MVIYPNNNDTRQEFNSFVSCLCVIVFLLYTVIINIIIIIYSVDTAIQRLHNWALMCVRETNCNFCCIEFYFIFITLRRQNPSFFLRN